MSMHPVRRLTACTLCVLLLCAEMWSQSPTPQLLPVKEDPQLLSMPKAPDANPGTPAPTVPFKASAATSISVSKQFMVHGGDLELRSAFCLLCEDTAASLGRVLKDSGQFVLPVIVVLKTPPDITVTGPTVTLSIGELTHGGFHLQINAQLRTDFRTTDFTRQLVRVLLAERILRNHKQLNTTRTDVLPPWIMTGVAQALEYRSRSKPSAIFSAVFRRGQVYSLDRILSADPNQLDALSRGIYESSTCALVLTLLDQPDGPVRFSKFLNALAADSKSDRDLLTQFFPNLATSKNALEKWWSLQMASLATPTAMESLNVSLTEEALDEALMLILPATKREAGPEKEAAPEWLPQEGKPGGLFGWMKRDGKEEAPPDEKAIAAPPKETKTEEPKDNPENPEATGEDDKKPRRKPGTYFTFPGSRKVVFPFRKKPADEAVDGAKPKDDKGKEKEKKAETAKPAASPPAPPSLSRKPGDARSIAGRPEDLPKAPPVAASKVEAAPPLAPKKKGDEPKTEETPADKPSALNPRNWFRKDDGPAGDPATGNKSPAKPAARAASAQAVARPAPAVRTSKADAIPLEDYALVTSRADRADIFNRCIARLSALKLKAHPLYKPLIADYTTLVEALAQGKTKGASTKLEDLRNQRSAVHAKAVTVETQLDWYEANHTGSMSHAFDDFLKLDEELEKERLPRNDSLSKYLDAVQKEFLVK